MTPKTIDRLHPIWVYPKTDPDWERQIALDFHIHPSTASVLATRGFCSTEDIHAFLYAKLPDLYDPDLFPDMDKAVERIIKALNTKEKILIYGDNDVDGITATALLMEFFDFIGGSAAAYIPSRNVDKQSVMLDASQAAHQHQCSLVITVDCGITEVDQTYPVDIIVTDHHEPTAKLPYCIATLNPKLVNSTYPNRHLTGVGVAFKLAHAVTNALVEQNILPSSKVDLKRYLDLVALGTIADMGALKGENRILVRYGLRQLRKTKRIGLAKLCSICEVKLNEISPIDIASKVAPRLNSLGRIADPNKGVELLLIRDPQAAEILAKELDLNNLERKKIERRDTEDVESLLKQQPTLLNNKAVVLHSTKWHPGIIPIIAARIAKQLNRPCAIIAVEDGVGKGSLRTIVEFPLLPFLKELSHLLINFGGHDYAAGLTIRAENINHFSDLLIQKANQQLKEQDIQSKLYIDGKVSFADLTFDFMEALHLLEPFGNENPAPVFTCEVKQTWPPKIIGKSHLKLFLEQNDRMLEGLAFNMAERRSTLLKKNLHLLIAFTPQICFFQNKSSIQLQIKDFQIIPAPRKK